MSLASHNPQDEPAVMSRRLRNYFVLKDFRKYTRSSVAVAHIRLSLADSCCETIRSPSARSSPETLGLYPRTPSRCSAPVAQIHCQLTLDPASIRSRSPRPQPFQRRSSLSSLLLSRSHRDSGHSLVAEGVPALRSSTTTRLRACLSQYPVAHLASCERSVRTKYARPAANKRKRLGVCPTNNAVGVHIRNFTTIMPVPSTSTTKNRVLLTIERVHCVFLIHRLTPKASLTPAVCEEALSLGARMLVSPQKPHPLLTTSNEPLALCGGQDIDILIAFDSVWGGVNDWLADLVSGRQSDQRAFIPDTIRDEGGEGRRVELEKPVEMSELVSRTKTGLGLSSKVMQTTEAHLAMFTLGGMQRWTLMNNCMRSHLHLEATTRWKAVARRSVTLVTHRGRRLPIVSVTPNAPNGTRTPILRPVRLHGSAVIAAPSGCGSLALGLRLGTPWTSCVGNPDLQQAFVGWDTNDRNETTLRGSPQFRAPTTVTDLRLGDAAKRQTC
ncbi:hypothetical protein C8F01DRAFT_1240977 [Mycena amicta]|nr:hypothetical protein C8F01DRAFT_1240977 [Mycena amicta]